MLIYYDKIIIKLGNKRFYYNVYSEIKFNVY